LGSFDVGEVDEEEQEEEGEEEGISTLGFVDERFW